MQNRIRRNLLGLYSLHAINIGTPLVTVPFLARRLGPETWGLLVFAQAFAAIVALPVEYGFAFSGTRKVAHHRDAPDDLAKIASGVLGSKLVLAILAGAVAVAVRPFIPMLYDHASLFWPALLWASGQAFSMAWLFQGLERVSALACIEGGFKLAAAAALLLFVRNAQDVVMAVWIQAGAASASALVGGLYVHREISFRIPSRRLISQTLRWGGGMLLYRATESGYGLGAPFLLGVLADARSVGYFAGADKIIRTLAGLLDPLNRALFPRIVRASRSGTESAAPVARRGALFILPISMAMSVGVAIAAPWIVRLLLGANFTAATATLRILAVLPVAIACKNILGVQWMVPLGLDRRFNAIMLLAAGLHLALAVLLAPRYGHLGMAAAVVSTELVIPLSMFVTLRMARLDPFQDSLLREGLVP
jgi:PST family polysaccharide transporter